MKIPKYIRSEHWIMFGITTPYVILINFLLLDEIYFKEAKIFVLATVLTLFIKVCAWPLHTIIAIKLRDMYPKDTEIMKRLGIALLSFFLLTWIVDTFLFLVYYYIHFRGYTPYIQDLMWVILITMASNIFITLFHEGVANFEKWKSTLTETEQLKTEYAKSQLESLKSQINPHYLFNSINTLSGLISENPVEAEIFLDEMCKVYRYALKNDKGDFVTLETELQFIRSWFHILEARYGHGIKLEINVGVKELHKQIPPLTLQLLIENVLNQNVISKKNPLVISITAQHEQMLEIRHNIATKLNTSLDTDETGLKNVINKFRLLGLETVQITHNSEYRTIQIPLVSHTEMPYESI